MGRALGGISSSMLMGSSKGLLSEERKELLPLQEERAVSFNLGEVLPNENRPLLRGNGLINEQPFNCIQTSLKSISELKREKKSMPLSDFVRKRNSCTG